MPDMESTTNRPARTRFVKDYMSDHRGRLPSQTQTEKPTERLRECRNAGMQECGNLQAVQRIEPRAGKLGIDQREPLRLGSPTAGAAGLGSGPVRRDRRARMNRASRAATGLRNERTGS